MKKIISWCLITCVLLVSFLSPMAIAKEVNYVTIGDVRTKLENAARVQLIASKFFRCIGGFDNDNSNGSISGSEIKYQTAQAGDIYSGSTKLNAGFYLEQLITGSTDDGLFKCKENDRTNITKLFAEEIGLTVNQIICNKDHPDEGGLLTPAKMVKQDTGGHGYQTYPIEDSTTSCQNAEYYLYRSNPIKNDLNLPKGKAYAKELYERYREQSKNEYLPTYDNLNNFDKVTGYALYLKEFEMQCSNSIRTEGAENDAYFFTIKYVNDSGEITERKYEHVNGKNNNSGIKELFVSTDTIKTCGNLVDKINSYVYLYQYEAETIMNKALKPLAQSCLDSFNENLNSVSTAKDRILSISSSLDHIYDQTNSERVKSVREEYKGNIGSEAARYYGQSLDVALNSINSQINSLGLKDGNNIYSAAYDQASQIAQTAKLYIQASKDAELILPDEALREAMKENSGKISNIASSIVGITNEYKNEAKYTTILSQGTPGSPVEFFKENGNLYKIERNTITCYQDEIAEKYNNKIKDVADGAGIDISYWTPPEQEKIEQNGSAEKDACFNSDLESMAWVICPVANNLASTVDSTMNRLESLLATESKYYDNNSATFKFWEYCRSLANIALSIIILVVIFSQITGRGIDNYGIKKILPRLILMAILINLSFTICQLAIDASNILGQSLATMLKGIAKGMNGGVDVSINFSKFIATLSGGAILVGGAAVGGFMALAEVIDGGASGGQVLGYVIVILVLILLVMIVAIIVFFASLAVRIMIIVIFAGLSPLAFACYILPNTHNLFKKWWNIFKTALIIYPICGALYGFSFIVSKIAQDSDSFFMGCVGLVSTVLPYLVIPDLVKRSIAGLGVVGSKLSSVGSALKNTAGKIKNAGMNSERMKEVRDRGRMNAATNRAERVRRREESTMDGVRGRQRELLDKIENGETLSSNERRELRRLNNRSARYAKANDMYERRVNEGNTNNFNTTREATLGRIAQNRASQENKASDSQSYGDREQYYVETLANGQKRVWTKNSSTGQYEHVDKKGTLTKKTAADMRAMNGQFIGARETDVNKANISRAEQAGMRSSFANASSAAEAAQRATRTAQLSSMNTMREKIDVNEAKALGVQAAKEDEKFRQIRNEAERGYVAKSDLTQQLDIVNRNNANVGANKAIKQAYTAAGGDITKVAKSIESNQLATTSQINETIGANRAVTDAIMREGSITKVAKSIESGQLDATNRLNVTIGANEAISKAIAKEGNISKVAKSIEANEQAQATQLSDTITGNRADVLAYQQAQADEKNRRVQREAENGYVAKSDNALNLEALNRNNATIGANQAIDNAIQSQGKIENIARSIEVNEQSQTSQLSDTIGTNVFTEKLVNEKVSSIKASNSGITEDEARRRAFEEITTTPEYARSLAEQRYNTSQQRMFSEELKNLSRNSSVDKLKEHIRDKNYVAAAMDDISNKGGIEDLNKFFADYANMNHVDAQGNRDVSKEVFDTITQKMSTMSIEPMVKAYGKYAVAEAGRGGTPASYEAWLKTTDNPTTDPDGKNSFEGFVRANGDTMLVNGTKDTFKFLAGRPDLVEKLNPMAVMNGALAARSNEDRNAGNALLKKVFEESSNPEATRTDLVANLSAGQFSHMELSTFESLLDVPNIDESTAMTLPAPVKDSLKAAAAKIKKSGGSVKANINPKILSFIQKATGVTLQ